MKTMLFNPYTGKPRHPSDIASDPCGLLMLDPDEPVRAYNEAQVLKETDAALHSLEAKKNALELKSACDDGFNAGTIASLAVVYAHDQETLWCEILRANNEAKLLYHAAVTEPDDWEWAGFAQYAKRNGFKKPRAKKG